MSFRRWCVLAVVTALVATLGPVAQAPIAAGRGCGCSDGGGVIGGAAGSSSAAGEVTPVVPSGDFANPPGWLNACGSAAIG